MNSDGIGLRKWRRLAIVATAAATLEGCLLAAAQWPASGWLVAWAAIGIWVSLALAAAGLVIVAALVRERAECRRARGLRVLIHG